MLRTVTVCFAEFPYRRQKFPNLKYKDKRNKTDGYKKIGCKYIQIGSLFKDRRFGCVYRRLGCLNVSLFLSRLSSVRMAREIGQTKVTDTLFAEFGVLGGREEAETSAINQASTHASNQARTQAVGNNAPCMMPESALNEG